MTSRRRKLVWGSLISVLVLLIGGELFARFELGLGDPPLVMADPQIGYLFRPSMHYRRFGHDISYNSYSMRSGPITPHKTDPNQLRILVIGDSVVNGGALTDDADLATTILQQRLTKSLGRSVFAGNVSAGGWGPINELAYIRKFGWFDADIAVLVYNSADYADIPQARPGMTLDMPDHPPLSALEEGFMRYLIPRLKIMAITTPIATSQPAAEENIPKCLAAIREIIQSARSAGVKKVIVVQHLDRREYDAPEWPGHAAIAATVRAEMIEPIQLEKWFRPHLAENLYRDDIHPNELGQKLIADALFDELQTTR